MNSSATTQKQMWIALVSIVIAFGIGLALLYWNHGNQVAYPRASIWQTRLIGFIWLLCMLIVFEAFTRAQRAGSRISFGLLAAGILLYALRIGVFTAARWRLLSDSYAIALHTPELADPFLLVSVFMWFLAIGCCAILQRQIRRIAEAPLERMSSPVLGVLLFLAAFRGLQMMSTWANFILYHRQSTFLIMLAIGDILLPFLYLLTYTLLTSSVPLARQRAIEWAMTGFTLALAFTIPRQLSVHGIWAWLGDAGTAMASIGVMALLLSLFSRRQTTETA
ncbi:hypothetical protein KKG90_00675 [Candidatus Bipolaricaulota bacterium]|nr:hypothetical protein [Candidatus Bipolaricaulota bacterium]